TQSYASISASGIYAVNVVTWRQMALADRFAGRGPLIGATFEDAPYRTAITGAPILEGCLAWVDCRVWAAHEGGDHVIFVGQVEAAGVDLDDSEALVHFNRRYLRLA